MKKSIFTMFLCLYFMLNPVQAQVKVIDSSTIKLGAYDNILSTDYVGKFAQAQGVVFGSSTERAC